MLHDPRLSRQPPKPSGTISLSTIGCPKRFSTDQGRNFESQLVADLCKLMGTQKLQTSLYCPQTNGHCERFNSTLIGMLEMLPLEKKSTWKNHIGALVHAYNCTQNSTTGLSPYYLLSKRQPCLPVDVALGSVSHSVMAPTASKFVQKLRNESSGPVRRPNHSRWKRHSATN